MLVLPASLPDLPTVVLYWTIIGLLLRTLFIYFRDARNRKVHGCEPIAKRHQLPLWGLDVALSQFLALRGHYFIPWLAKMHINMPKTFSFTFLGTRQIYTIEPENLKALTAINWKDFGISPIRRNSKASMPFADKGVNTVDGEDWVFSRFLIKPFFDRKVYTSTDRIAPFVDHFLHLLPDDGKAFDIQPHLQRWFLDVTTKFIFGEAMDAMSHPERANITWAMLDILRGGRLRIQIWRCMWLLRWGWWYDAITIVHDFMNGHIRQAYSEVQEREAHINASLEVGPERQDLLWYMASNCRDEEELRSQLCLLFVPNNDTTSIFISNCVWHLARNLDAWDKCREEIAAHGDAPLTFGALRGLKYINGVLNETHRLNPNNVIQVRQCLNDTILPVGGGQDGKSPIYVRKGDIVQVTKTVLHRDKDFWGSDADEFRPERWMDDGLRPFWNFVPFGGGPRRCPAQWMVTTEASYMLARLAQVYRRIEPRDPAPYTAVMRIGPSNKTGVQVALYK
ncbi:cytochrome P450 [Penicillium taxi]|uniref:cytochrome P450 n=1 Tax=Penicillium taxi TaxID=168475 RepID=UPI0025452B07|nr:cytochrome P450 [Penicillium taxi]KAJ5909076.1 cytochrome P450 [Penicillium taxi]